ncbi:Hypothetical predicted protein [Pelobates cultripes]|nr:Hypothetical predicted protein [Pelobates cultripes]
MQEDRLGTSQSGRRQVPKLPSKTAPWTTAAEKSEIGGPLQQQHNPWRRTDAESSAFRKAAGEGKRWTRKNRSEARKRPEHEKKVGVAENSTA